MQLSQSWLTQQGSDGALLRAIDRAFNEIRPARIGIAVSGGSDSTALLHLFARWSARTGHPLAAVTVDHGLRSGSCAEAEDVAALCAKLSISHDILEWHRPEGAGNLAAAARDGRYGLMAEWAQARGVGGIALGHTMDDTAENFVMRLGRAAGVDGLALMAPLFRRAGITWARPLLAQKRSDLRAYLERHSIGWSDDPSNDDPRYLRSQARRLLPTLGSLGITADSLHHSAQALRQAQEALAHYTRIEAQNHVKQVFGDILIPLVPSPPPPEEITRRLVMAALQWVGSQDYPPRKRFTDVLVQDLDGQMRTTIAGCVILRREGHYHITREYNAVKGLVTQTDVVWDTRWRLEGPHEADLCVRALGDAVGAVPDWRAAGMPRRSLMASPAVWRGDLLVAAPLAGYNPVWSAQIVADFTSFLLSH